MRNLAHLRVIGGAFLVLIFGWESPARSAPVPDDSLKGGFVLKPLDGATIRAVEKRVNPDPNSLGLSLGLYPFDPYYMGFVGSANYTYQFDETFGWEVLNASYAFTVNKGLVEELAAQNVTPNDENPLQYMVSTNFLYAFAYGKALLFKDFIRYFRASVLGGLGAAGTQKSTAFGVDFGLRLEFYAGESLSWRIEIRNLATVTSGSSTYPTFHLGIGIGL